MSDSGQPDDPVVPRHYSRFGDKSPDDVIEAWGLGFRLGNCLKYLARAGHKPGADVLTDLKKAAWYLNREIERREARNGDGINADQ